MSALSDFFVHAEAGMQDILCAAIPDGVTISFELNGDEGGVWRVTREGLGVSVRPGRPERADCRLICAASDFRLLMRGELQSRDGFMQGRLRVEGDVGLVLRLEQAINRRPRNFSL